MADWFAAETTDNKTDSATSRSNDKIPFHSRRSPVICRNGCVASSQPLASSIGLDFLRKGANAADAAIAVAAALCVTEPCSTGLGGDMFCLYFDNATKKVSAINGSGCSPSQLTLERVQQDCTNNNNNIENNFCFSPHAVTVPGAAKGYEDLLNRHGSGKFTLAELLEPAAILAQDGFPVAPITSHHWRNGMAQIEKWIKNNNDNNNKQDYTTTIPLTVDGKRGPMPGEIIKNPDLANVLRELGLKGATNGFYNGFPGLAIVQAIQKHGGVMTINDLQQHKSTFPEPIFAQYRNIKLWQVPPNGQGIAGLIALTGLEYLETQGACTKISPQTIGTADSYHVLIEMMRLGFQDARDHVADPNHATVTNEWLLDKDRINQRAIELYNPNKAAIQGIPTPSSCTVSFQVVDSNGNAISFVNSNFMGFGSGIVPDGCGFSLQNRGFGFSLTKNHPNVIGPNKRPYHTIIPGMITHADNNNNNDLYATISNMGGNMQPQGHLQLTVNMIAGGLDPQAAIDMPRFCIANGTKSGAVSVEAEVKQDVVNTLKQRGHNVKSGICGFARGVFGRAQIIKRDCETGVLWAGSDGRADGCAMGY